MEVRELFDNINANTQAIKSAIDLEDSEVLLTLSEERGKLIKELGEFKDIILLDKEQLSKVHLIIEDTNALAACVSVVQKSLQPKIANVNQTKKALNQYELVLPNTQGYFVDKYE